MVSFLAVSMVSSLNLVGQVQIFENSVVREKRSLLTFLNSLSHKEDSLLSTPVLEIINDSGNVSFLWIVGDDGEVYYSNNERMKGVKIEDPFIGINSFKSRKVEFEGARVKVIAQPLSGSRTAIMGVNMVTVTAFLIPAFARASVILLFAILGSVFLSLILTEKTVYPLLKLRKAIKKIGDEEFNQKIEIETGDEIEEIGREFNQMAERLQNSRKKLEESKKILEIRVRARTKELEKMTNTLEEKVEARTEELQRKVEELEKFHKLTVGREKKMINLKKKNKKLKEEIRELREKIKNLENNL